MKRIISIVLAAAMGLGAVAATAGSASAAWRGPYGGWHGGPGPGWRGGYYPRPGWGGGYYPRPGWGYGGGYYGGWGPGAAAAGAVIGLGLGAAIANSGGGYQVAPPYGAVGWREHAAWCAGRYRSYNPGTDTFIGYNGQAYRCVSP